MVTDGTHSLETGREQDAPEEVRFELPSLIGCQATRCAEPDIQAKKKAEECLLPSYLRQSSVTINGGGTLSVKSGWWKVGHNVDVDVLDLF